MTPSRSSVFGRHIDPLQAARGIAANLVFCVIVWTIGWALFVWAMH